MAVSDDVLVRVAEAAELTHRGDKHRARTLFLEIWDEVGAERDALYRCAVAHGLADARADARAELAWDLRALNAASELTDARATEVGMPPPAAMLASLHLNLGDIYLRLGDPASAHRHADAGLAAADSLPDDGYGATIRRELDGLKERLTDDQVRSRHP